METAEMIFLMFYIPLLSLMLDFINFGPFTLYYDLKWRYIKWRTHEQKHEWGNWIMINGGTEQIRFCKNCGKLDKR